MQFESSGKWPADLEAVGALKAAFYLKMAAQLEESASIHAEASRHALYVQCDGFTFVGRIRHDQELALLRASGRPAVLTLTPTLTLTLTLTPTPTPTLTLTLTRQICAAAVSTAASAVV